MTLVALSASYGALGSEIGPRVAEQLEVPFIDRAIPLGVADTLNVPLEDADADEGRPGLSFLERLLAAFQHAEPVTGPMPVAAASDSDEFRRATEEVPRRQTADGRGVILGRGSVLVLRDRPDVLRVRLDGPADARTRAAMKLQGIDRETAERRRRAADRAHAEYARLYDADLRDPRHYHLMLDATALPVSVAAGLIVTAARGLGR
jgi:hypothetical protein